MDAESLIAELEDAIQSGSKDKRVETLRRITDLFIADADRLSDKQIEVFDDVLGHLIKRIEGRALAELSRRLGPISNAPLDVVHRLARDDDIVVAEPIYRFASSQRPGPYRNRRYEKVLKRICWRSRPDRKSTPL